MHERPQPLLELLCRSCELGELRRWDIQHCPCLPRHRIVLHYDIRKPHDSGRTPHCFHLGYLEYEEWLHAGLAILSVLSASSPVRTLRRREAPSSSSSSSSSSSMSLPRDSLLASADPSSSESSPAVPSSCRAPFQLQASDETMAGIISLTGRPSVGI